MKQQKTSTQETLPLNTESSAFNFQNYINRNSSIKTIDSGLKSNTEAAWINGPSGFKLGNTTDYALDDRNVDN